jgi:ComF family protein
MFLKELLFPKFCLGCHKIGAYLCPECQNKLEYFTNETCLYCHKKSPYGLTHPGCQKRWGIDGALTIFHYNQTLKQIIKAFKYRQAIAVWEEFSLLINPEKLNRVKNWSPATFLQPIPLHQQRFKERGFNQAEIIAQFFNRFLKLKIGDCLLRNKETKPQAQISEKKERKQNMSQAFIVKNKKEVKNATIILVDDLLTTGETVKAAGKVLKKEGARFVFALTIARG